MTRFGLVGALCVFGAATAHAQRRAPLEFTQQGVYVSNFASLAPTGSTAKPDPRLGRRAGDAVREWLDDVVNKRETKIINGYDIRDALIRAGYPADQVFTNEELHQQGRYFRIDEIVVGSVTRLPRGVRVDATLMLYRDMTMRQPLGPVTANDVDAAARTVARRLEEARVQLKFQRRCENALRDGYGLLAIQHAREGVAAYPKGALARTCLVMALASTGGQAQEVLDESLRVLEVDPISARALEAAASALDKLGRRSDAADMWLRLAATDSNNVELAERVVWAMAEHGNSRRAEPLIVKVSNAHPGNLKLARQKWRIANDNRNWPLAVETGESLMANDAEARGDSIFYLRLATAYRMHGQPFRSVEIVARGVATFPGDARLYALYTQFVKEEADTAISRGIALYPGSAELAALHAKDLRTKGKVAEALDASKRAVQLDSTIAQGRLLVAQGEMELGRPDSALAALQQAATAGEDASTVAQFALSKGSSLFRAANGTKARADFMLAMRFLSFADSLKSTMQTKFMLGAAALGVAQAALTDAPKVTVKEESCALAQQGSNAIPVARASLEVSRDVSPDAVKQFLDYLDVMLPVADKQVAVFCAVASTPPSRQ